MTAPAETQGGPVGPITPDRFSAGKVGMILAFAAVAVAVLMSLFNPG